jgi:LuxR family maltose regulon positive regulatory protein
LTRARLLVATGDGDDLAEASGTLDALEAAATSVNNVLLSIGVRAVRGLESQARGDLEAALRHVSGAVAAAAPGGLMRTFVDLGLHMRGLLAELARRSVAPDQYITRLLAAFPLTPAPLEPATPSSSGPGPRLIDALTEHEIEVLNLLAARLSSREIAVSLGISSETVKRHTRTIYRKLMIRTRRAALDRAVALGLLAPLPAAPEQPPGHTEGE